MRRESRPGFVGLDQVDGPHTDHVLDLTRDRYPFPDRSVDEVFSSHFLEHVDVPNHVFGEIARICKDGARIEFWTPYAFSNEAFLYGHLHFITEELWMHFCVTQRDYHVDLLKGRWQLHRIVYVVLPETLEDLARQGLGLGFAIRYLKGVVHELGVEIEFRTELGIPATVPTHVFATSREAERLPVDEWRPPDMPEPPRHRLRSRLARGLRRRPDAGPPP